MTHIDAISIRKSFYTKYGTLVERTNVPASLDWEELILHSKGDLVEEDSSKSMVTRWYR